MRKRFVIVGAAILFAFAGIPSWAQTPPAPPSTPQPAPGAPLPPVNGMPNLPPEATKLLTDILTDVAGRVSGAFGYNPNRAYGTVTYYKRFSMQVQLQMDKFRDVELHQGTVINPRGTTIRPGDQVDVYGHPGSNGSLEADTIIVHRH